MPGRAVCPSSWNRGPVDAVACREATGASDRANEVGHTIRPPAVGRLRSRVGWWSACGWGSGMPAPSGQIPPPWARWENEAPTTRTARSPAQAQPLIVHNHHLLARQAEAADDAGYAGTTCRSAGPAVAAHTPRGPAASTSWTNQGGPRSHPATRPEPGSTRTRMPLSSNPPEYGPPSQTAPPPTTGPT